MRPVTERQLLPERMDDPALPAADHRAALRGLARINFLSAAAGAFWTRVRDLAGRGRPLRVLDVASGGGDVAVGLWQRARRERLPVEVAGCDRSGRAVEHALARARRAGADVDFFQCDALADPWPEGYDVSVCSLFLHHLDEERATALLARMARGRALLVQDLERRRAGYCLAWLGTRLLTRSRVVHHDGPRSVRNAFTVAEARALAARAGLAGATVTPRWPFRYLLEWRRP